MGVAAPLEKAIVICGTVAVVGFVVFSLVRGRSQREPREECEAWLSPGRELGLIVLTIAVALLVRTIGWDWPLSAPLFFSETTQLYADDVVARGVSWRYWLQLLRQQPHQAQVAAMFFPAALAAQRLVGPMFHLPVLIGAVFGTAGVGLAWGLGRSARSRSFGLVFAAFVALSPLQLAWSRIGGIFIAGVAHLALVLWLSVTAGRRRSVALAGVVGVVAWASLYQYFAARVSIPLAFAAVVAGALKARASWRQSVLLLAAVLVGFEGSLWLVSGGGRGILWPGYGGYAGNRGERTMLELATLNAAPVWRELTRTLRVYFLAERTGFYSPQTLGWGMDAGGLCLVPVAVLGIIGLVDGALDLRRGWLWIVAAAVAFAPPILSTPSARRLLMFDFVWCALAASGVMVVMRWRPWRDVSHRALRSILVVVFLGLLGWSFGSIWVLNAGLRGDNDQFIPFGESGFGDARACMRCVRAGHEWKEEIAIGHMVILVDNDLDREVTGSPAGLPLYGKLAALAAGEQDRFMDFYDVMTNQDRGPPRWEHFFDPWKTDFASFLMERIDAASPSEIVWHFERPTRWEHWFVENLRKAGGRVAEFSTPLSKTPGMQVRFAWADRDALFSILRDLGERATVQDGGCVSIRPIKVTPYPSMVTHVAGSGRYDADGVPEWLVVSWTDARLGDVAMAAVPTIGSAVEAVDDGYRVRLLSIWHGEESQEIPSGRHSHRGIQLAGGGTSDCAVRVGEQWWSVDPTRGSLSTTAQRHDTIPGQEWCGIAVGTGNELLLASADQWIVRLDCLTGREKGRFRAAVWPSLRLVTNECSPVVVGNGWYATLNNLTSLLTVYDAQGGELGVRRLDDVLQLRYPSIKAIAAQGDYLAVANLGSVSTLELRVSPACTGKTSIRPTQNQEP